MKRLPIMARNNRYPMNRKLRNITLIALLLLAGNVAMAQNDGAYVIKKSTENHFLKHVKVGDNWVLQDATEFSPDCLWYSGRDFNISGTNHNYYFFDETGTPRYLAAPFQAGGTIYLSTTPPETFLLSNPDMDYYFYDWDDDAIGGRGVARGHKYAGITSQSECNHDWDDGAGECWEAYWVGYSDATGWKLSATSAYDLPEDFAARYRSVQVTLHPTNVTASTGGGLTGINVPASMNYQGSEGISASISDYNQTYIPAYGEYTFENNTHYYYNNSDHSTAPTAGSPVNQAADSYTWTITGEGAAYLSFVNNASNPETTSNIASPTLYYVINNTTGHKTATVTLTVTYPSGATQTSSATVQVRMACGNPTQAAAPIINGNSVTVSWIASADQYRLEWKKQSESAYGTPVDVGNVTSYTITGLEYNIDYDYRVTGCCGTTWQTAPTNPTGSFKTQKEPNLVVYGAIFGGGRMADVTGKTEIAIINCDSIGAIYGGNDIAGEVQGADGSTITLGVEASSTSGSYSHEYNNNAASTKVRVHDVYGGGNGYYAYNGTSFVAASNSYTSQTVADGASVKAMTQNHTVGEVVWTNNTGSDYTMSFPSIVKTAITMTNDVVKVDSIFGGAKNAFLTASSGNSSSIILDGGTAFAVFGGNNFGGLSGTGSSKLSLVVNGTKAETSVADYNSKETGRDFGVRYLFGGGNKVAALESDILIAGGQCDTVFAGGNSADVATAKVVVNCSVASGSGVTFGNTYSNAIASATSSSVTVKDNDNYPWNGTGIYNVRTLFGGNNRANMAGLPTVTLTSGSVGTVYGGGNAGDMLAQTPDGTNGLGGPIATDFSPPMKMEGGVYVAQPIWYGTHVVMNQATMLVDYLYGGCQMSDVEYSAWVEIQNGHVGTVYGGCNISGDVGSGYRISYTSGMPKDQYQLVKGGTYVKATGGTVHGNLFAGSNGFYHCNNGVEYVSGLNFGTPPYDPEERYVGMVIPTHNETHVKVSGTTIVEGNVYAGGNMAYVGFIPSTDQWYRFRDFVGLASVRMDGGTVEGDVYGGGNRASVFGSNEVKVSGGTINGALYGGNDRAGQVAQISNRVFYGDYGIASDGHTNLKTLGVNTYVSVTGRPDINTVYGGGNGAYTYDPTEYCDITDQPVQSNTFVDINIDGYPDGAGGHIATVYGGGNGVTVTGGITVLLNVKGEGSNPPLPYDHVDNLFGGNNQGPLAILPEIILMNGQANTVYGGCNAGAMTGSHTVVGTDNVSYNNVGSRVHLRPTYTPVGTNQTLNLNGTVSHAVYGGCRMNGVDNNSLVLVEGGTYAASLFGGSDISGDVSGTSQVVVKGGTVGNVYGGGNGDYDYTNTYQGYTAPTCATSLVDILGGQVGKSGTNNARNVFGGGLGHNTNTIGNVTVNIGTETMAAADVPVIYGDVYGGSALGSVNGTTPNTTYQTTVNVLNGTLHGNVYGGGLGYAETNTNGYLSGNGDVTEAYVYGTVQVNIGHPESDNNTHSNYSNYLTIDGSVFGGNNLAGSPKANVNVDVYRTAHTSANQYPATFPDPLTNAYFEDNTLYALHEVYGGGNLAAYVPTLTDAASNVHIHNCDNTIQYVYGGGNAADVPTSDVTIDGGLIQYVFGGGNGYGEGNPGANVLGNNTLNLDGGVMCFVFGGSNTKGGVGGTTDLNFADTPSCGVRSINELYGGGNQAPDVDGITLNVPCGTSGVKAIYGGSRMANVGADGSPQNVVLNVRGGELDKIFGGNNQGGIIYGNVTVNLYGGTITDVFGGNNQGGNVKGVITVNVLDEESTACPLILTNVFGGGNEVAYVPADPTIISPVVNVMHIKEKTGATGIKGNVYGGGNEAGVTSNPQVNIGYVSALSSYVPSTYNAPASYRAYVVGNVYGGGNEAGVTGDPTVNMNNGTVVSGLYGGCNTEGTVDGDPSVNVYDGTIGDQSNANRGIVYGGGLGSATKVKGSITVNVNGANAVLWGDVYGGSAKGLVNCNDTGDAATSGSTTTVTLTDGTIHGDLYGGGHGLDNATAHVWGPVAVEVNGGTVNNVFGGNNLSGTPKDKIEVTIGGGEVTNVFGGGNQADYTAPTSTPNYPEVSITNGEVTHKVVGGGNEAGITGNPTIFVTGGSIGTDTDASAGIYGGCNTSGTVNGNTVVTITGGTIGESDSNTANIHGGGFGSSTSVTGDVTVNFGEIVINNSQEVHTNAPVLYGALYGGSALGNVNTNASNTTTVNILNGQINGSVYGGGLGQKNGVNGASGDIAALVNGVVHVNIGEMESWTDENTYVLNGMADLVNCNIYGCNNLNGTPKDEVYVDVYKTYHIPTNEASYLENDATYAIENVFGGGNQAHYQPVGYNDYSSFTPTGSHRTRVYFHGCDNTSRNVYGGGNAADAFGVITIIEGGRYNEIFGGGNGMVTPANIGMGGIGRRSLSGHVNYQFEGSNRQGENFSHEVYVATLPSTGTIACSGDMITDSYFFGTNMAETYGDLTDEITCTESNKYNYRYVYAGSRWAVIYGDVTITVNGGTIENLFGGSRGYNETGNTVSADIRKYPDDWEQHPELYSAGLIEYMTTHPGLEGTGGNITVILNGGTIGNVFGGCDVLGNVEGKITIIVNETDDACGLQVGNIYGASNLTSYTPTGDSGTDSPEVKIQKAQVGFTTNVFYSSQGADKTFEGNVFGGGNHGDCTSSPKVVIGTVNNATNVTINGDVFGGGNEGNVTGSSKVIIVPTE